MTSGSHHDFIDLIAEQNKLFLHTVNAFNIIHGKKALQKILYFVDLDYHRFSYRWDKFGPFSPQLNYLFDDAVADYLLSVEKEELSPGINQFNMSLSNSGIEFVRKNKLSPEVDSKIKYVHNFLNGETARKMELLASVHKIINDYKTKDTKSILKMIKSLKPKSGFTSQEVSVSINKLKENSYI